MKPTTFGIVMQIPLWLILVLVAIGPLLPDASGNTHPVVFIIVIGVIAAHIWGLLRLRKAATNQKI
ncbi:MAG: hypothetical protein DRP42_05465 [Tenericutes bacterium]|nr:MAG: hypothetical protein DRP42_05465 [Mycoplasmatota bacterium]